MKNMKNMKIFMIFMTFMVGLAQGRRQSSEPPLSA